MTSNNHKNVKLFTLLAFLFPVGRSIWTVSPGLTVIKEHYRSAVRLNKSTVFLGGQTD